MISKKVITVKFMVSLVLIVARMAILVYANNFPKGEEKAVINPSFVSYDEGMTSEINMDEVTIEVDETNNVGILQYTVQAGDTLGKIASMFGTTVEAIKKINKITGPIRGGQKLIVSDDEDGFLYTIKENINVAVFVNKYNLHLEDFMSLNYIQDESEMLYKGQDVFVNMSTDLAYTNGLLEKPIEKLVIKPSRGYVPVINKPQSKQQVARDTSDNEEAPRQLIKKSSVISQWVFKKNIKNGFYPGYCTWYAAIISPEIFPYSAENNQQRDFGGNAREWCANAKAAGYRVGKTPAAGALIVYNASLGRLRSAGHVGKVINYYPEDGKMIIRDMNRVAKFVVTERWEETNNSNIKCYIYPGK